MMSYHPRLATRLTILVTLLISMVSHLWSTPLKPVTICFEGEDVTHLSGKAFQIQRYTKDKAGSVSGMPSLRVPPTPKGTKVPYDTVEYQVRIPADGTYYLWGTDAMVFRV